MLLNHDYRVGRATNHLNNTNMMNYENRPLNKPVTAVISQHTYKCTTNSDIAWQNSTQNWVVERQRAPYAKQNTSEQLLFHIRFDRLKLPRDPLKAATGVPATLTYSLMGSLLLIIYQAAWPTSLLVTIRTPQTAPPELGTRQDINHRQHNQHHKNCEPDRTQTIVNTTSSISRTVSQTGHKPSWTPQTAWHPVSVTRKNDRLL